jgi:pyruvate/2-oxoglutarate dehydrogenase complex dihydrolipoamide acyltransferase (E2) component
MLTLNLSCDHRAVDGARAARFLDTLAKSIQDPLSMLD